MGIALTDVIKLGEVELESSYPYTARQQSCKFDISKAVAKVKICKVYETKTKRS